MRLGRNLCSAVVAMSAIAFPLVTAAPAMSIDTNWRQEKLPLPFFEHFGEITAVKAVTAKDVWAVGDHLVSDANPRLIVLHRDAKAWHVVAGIPQLSVPNSLLDVDASGAADVWAVGTDGDEGLVLHYDGSKWRRLVTPPSPDLPQTIWAHVRAFSSHDVWIAGQDTTRIGTSPSQSRTITAHWNGRGWTVYRDLVTGTYIDLGRMAAVSTTSVFLRGNGALLHWDGQRWKQVTGALSKAKYGFVLHAGPDGHLWSDVGTPPPHQGMVARWSGQRWVSQVTSRIPRSESYVRVWCVTTPQPGVVWAAGYMASNEDDNFAFIGKWNDGRWVLRANFQRLTPESMTSAGGQVWVSGWSFGQPAIFTGT